MSANDANPPKRMRLGTRSCAECRRRKVRCIFPAQGTVCTECLAHDSPCRVQQASSFSSSSSNGGAEFKDELRQQSRKLDSIIQLLSQNSNQEKPSIMKDLNVVEGTSSDRNVVTLTSAMDILASAAHSTRSSHEEHFDRAPLVHLFKSSLNARPHHQKSDDHIRHILGYQIDDYIASLNALIPQMDDLLLILESTMKYWFIWPAPPPGLTEENNINQYGNAAMVKDFIFTSFESKQQFQIVRGILWLALCIQQLPGNVIQQRINTLPAPLPVLFDAYVAGAEAILAALGESLTSPCDLESLLLLAKTWINMGRPQRAWLTIRRAADYALIFGLHQLDQHSDTAQRSIWSHVWQLDRQLSSILGMPYSVAHPKISPDSDQPVVATIMEHINNIVGHISDRNQGLLQRPIHEIETEIQECSSLFPEDWWLLIPPEDVSFEFLYTRQVCKMYFFQLKAILYLPDMLRSLNDHNFSQDNREISVDACRGLVSAYEVLRNSSKSALVICNVMDFLAFSAALIIVLHLIAPSGQSRDVSRDPDDWRAIMHLVQTFRQLSRALECSVAEQSATLLEYLHTAYHNTYAGPEEYIAVIPWFGKVKICNVPRQQNGTSSQTASLEDSAKGLWNTIEVGVNYGTPAAGFGTVSSSWGNHRMDDELGIDWTSLDEADWNYDWNHTFYSAGYDTIGL